MHTVEDHETASGVRLRCYIPHPDPDTIVLYVHGGGFVFGDIETYDALCRRLARATGAAVLSVDYRRAPEHPAPAAIDDVVQAHAWLTRPDRPRRWSRIALAGDSAGGAIALLAAVALREQGHHLDSLLLLYPNTDMTLSYPSITTSGTGWGLDASDLAWLIRQWIPTAHDRQAPHLNPLTARLDQLPPTCIVTAEHDPLRDEGTELARRLRAAGIPTSHLNEPGLVHGFLGLAHLSPAADEASNRAFTLLRTMLTNPHH